MNKVEFFSQATALTQKLHARVCPDIPISGTCLLWAASCIHLLRKAGITDACLQAGSASWRCCSTADDDGVSPLYFQYMWTPSPTAMLSVIRGQLPEMHAWVGIPSTQEVVDATTVHLPEQSMLLAGPIWKLPRPEPTWDTLAALHARESIYRGNAVATKVAFYIIDPFWKILDSL